ncbi:protein EARLY FLOWERING 3-like [Corylus avellana]|uniref:protein EARLY FLOWERING 3-like n=1 Tax=Corylus avellana TaxID=13451 RepID=UPI00286AFA04|nr:protein EARLY FLOWERING 3-like [Corylus avellana]
MALREGELSVCSPKIPSNVAFFVCTKALDNILTVYTGSSYSREMCHPNRVLCDLVLDPTHVTLYSQQRVFAVQVFELHRLIKVQQLIAESPNLLLEDGTFLGKASLTVTPAKKLPLKYVLKPPSHIVKGKDNSENPNHKMEFSAENAVGKTCLSSVKNGSQPSNYGPYPGHLQPATMATGNNMGPWSFHQSPGHQWLIPVVSPSEGLIYKPYPGPGYMGTVCGGAGPFSPAPLTGNFMNPAYGVPASPHHQGIGNLPGTTPLGHSYLPLYDMVHSPG